MTATKTRAIDSWREESKKAKNNLDGANVTTGGNGGEIGKWRRRTNKLAVTWCSSLLSEDEDLEEVRGEEIENITRRWQHRK